MNGKEMYTKNVLPRQKKLILFYIYYGIFIVLYTQPSAGFDRENYLAIYRLQGEKGKSLFCGETKL
jgi:hypothetical protein